MIAGQRVRLVLEHDLLDLTLRGHTVQVRLRIVAFLCVLVGHLVRLGELLR